MDKEAFSKAISEIGQKILYAQGERLVNLQKEMQLVTKQGISKGLSAAKVEPFINNKVEESNASVFGHINPLYDIILDD